MRPSRVVLGYVLQTGSVDKTNVLESGFVFKFPLEHQANIRNLTSIIGLYECNRTILFRLYQ